MAKNATNRTARKSPVIARDGNVNTLNSDMTTETLYTRPGSNMGDQPFLMDVSERGHAEILDELTDLSANKGAYALREVYSNAHDATVRVGDMSRPIEITIPDVAWATDSLAEKLAMIGGVSDDNIQYAYVTDHGIGMTEYDLRTYFTQYGGSNKRDDVASIGSKGLGSKAPLAVADYFDVVTSKDGVRTGMHLWRAEDGNYAEVTSSEPCPADETGTTVKIPVMNPTIGKQMLECAEEIARYNSDAVVLVNGQRTASVLNREVGSVSVIGGCSYVSVGTLRIGVDQAGNPVMVPAWLSKQVFDGELSPWTDTIAGRSRLDIGYQGIRAVLCGIGYQLQESNSSVYRHYGSPDPSPTCIVEIEPGYLNFTVSRDEIKSDARKAAIVDALREAIDSLNLWPVAMRLNAHDFGGLRKLVEGHSLRKVGAKWVLTDTFSDFQSGSSYVLTDADIEMFDDAKGRSMLPLVATFDGCDDGGHDARLMAWFSSAYNGKSARFHCAYADDAWSARDANADNWNSDLLGWRHGTDSQHGADGENSFSPNIAVIYDVIDNVLPYSQIASAVRDGFDAGWSLMVIGGVEAKAFAKAEHSIRRHVAAATGNTVLTERVLYVLCDGPVSDDPDSPDCLSEAELALLDAMGGHVEVAMLDELARRCAKEDRARQKGNAPKARRKGPKPLGTFLCTVAELDESKFSGISDLVSATKRHPGVPSLDGLTLKATEAIDLDDLGQDDLVAIGRPDTGKVTLVAMQAMLLQKMGRLDARYDRIVFVPASHDCQNHPKGTALYAPQAKRLARQVTVLADLREQWAVDGIRSVMGGVPFLTDDGIDLDKAGIEPDDDIAVAIATYSEYIGAGGRWFLDNIDVGLGIAKKALALAGTDNRFAKSVMRITTESPAALAFSEWMHSVWSVATAYSVSDVIENADDPDIEFFVKTMMNGVVREATEAYEKAIAKAA